MISISPGHFGPKTGASGIIDEVSEAIKVSKKVAEILNKSNVKTNYIQDNVSKSQKSNINWLVNAHNKSSRKLDVSVHFNSSGGTSNKGIGTEVLVYGNSTKDLASDICKSISEVSGLINRGVKVRTDLGFLRGTNKPSVLLEICFVNSSVDVALYRRDFNKICEAIAKELSKYVGGKIINDVSSTVGESEIEKRAKKLIDKAVEKGLFKDVHDTNKYNKDQLLRYVTILGERLI